VIPRVKSSLGRRRAFLERAGLILAVAILWIAVGWNARDLFIHQAVVEQALPNQGQPAQPSPVTQPKRLLLSEAYPSDAPTLSTQRDVELEGYGPTSPPN